VLEHIDVAELSVELPEDVDIEVEVELVIEEEEVVVKEEIAPVILTSQIDPTINGKLIVKSEQLALNPQTQVKFPVAVPQGFKNSKFDCVPISPNNQLPILPL